MPAQIMEFLGAALTVILFALRVLVPVLSLAVLWRCFVSLRHSRRREDPVILLEGMTTHVKIPVLYWESLMGRNRNCDIVPPDNTASRDHVVLMCREAGQLTTDTNSKAGTLVNGTKVSLTLSVTPGDVIATGSTTLMLRQTNEGDFKKEYVLFQSNRRLPSPLDLMSMVFLIRIFPAAQPYFSGGTSVWQSLVPSGVLAVLEQGLYHYFMRAQNHINFELEIIGLALSRTGIMLLAGADVKLAHTQLVAMAGETILFYMLISFMGDPDRVTKWRIAIDLLIVTLFTVNLAFNVVSHEMKNWISPRPTTVQPSEFIRITFVFAGASTFDRLQTAKNLIELLVPSGVCIGFLFLMKDFDMVSIFFITFPPVSFMCPGSLRTVILTCSAAALGVFIILQFKSYIADHFAMWRYVQEYSDGTGYQQTRVLSYTANGGLLGAGMGEGYLKDVFVGTNDLMFDVICEKLGMALAVVVTLYIMMLAPHTKFDAACNRSTFYSIVACSATGTLLFQAALNIFDATDVLPLTGVMLPFLSTGGSNMASVQGLLAFMKASDERMYAARRKST